MKFPLQRGYESQTTVDSTWTQGKKSMTDLSCFGKNQNTAAS